MLFQDVVVNLQGRFNELLSLMLALIPRVLGALVVVVVGSTVVVQKVGSKETRKFSIVGSEEADMAKGKLSYKSPLGEALLNKGKGETVSFKSPAGIIQYKITDIE